MLLYAKGVTPKQAALMLLGLSSSFSAAWGVEGRLPGCSQVEQLSVEEVSPVRLGILLSPTSQLQSPLGTA